MAKKKGSKKKKRMKSKWRSPSQIDNYESKSSPKITFADKVGRWFCYAHRRDRCHECGYDFVRMNEMAEVSAGLRKPPSKVEKLAEEKVGILTSLEALKSGQYGVGMPSIRILWLESELRRYDRKLSLEAKKGADINQAIFNAQEKKRAQDAGLEAVKQAWARENPGQRVMECSGENTQRLWDKFAAKPPSAAAAAPDLQTCAYCGKASPNKALPVCTVCKRVAYCNRECQKAAWKGHKKDCKQRVVTDLKTCGHCKNKSGGSTKLRKCSGCKQVAYCNRDCQNAAWKDHKMVCGKSKKEIEKKDRKKVKALAKELPVSWNQLEAYGGGPAEGKVLEIRALNDESLTRQVFGCKDRLGVVKRVAAYTDSRRIPGLASGKILRWKNPRFHYFMDGSSGARIEEEDLDDITVL